MQSKVTSENESAVFSFTGFLSRGVHINSEEELDQNDLKDGASMIRSRIFDEEENDAECTRNNYEFTSGFY